MPMDSGLGMPAGIGFFFTLVPMLMIAMIGYSIYSSMKEKAYNQSQPRLSVPAKVVVKRQDVSTTHHQHDEHTSHQSTTHYYVTFEFETGDRKEFSVTGAEFGMLAEEDQGTLSFQGNEYQSFERKRAS